MGAAGCSWVQLGAVLHSHIVFKADAALLCKWIRTCLLLGVCKDLCTAWYDMELIIKLCVCPYCRVKRPGPTCGACQWDSEGRESWEEWECAGQVQVRDAICLSASHIRTICLLKSTPWVMKTPLTCHRTKDQGCTDLMFGIRYVSDSGSRTWMCYMVNSQVHSALIYTQPGFMWAVTRQSV